MTSLVVCPPQVLHRDLSANNVLLTRLPAETADDDDGDVKVSDFGVSKANSIASRSLAHAGNTVCGTPQCFSPELVNGERYGAPADAAPECEFWNFSVQYDSNLCNHFTLGRSSSMPQRAVHRALQCAAAHGAECVLSPEVGLAVPAAFVFDERGQVQTVLGPRLLPLEDAEDGGS